MEGITRLQKLMFLLSKERVLSRVRQLKFEAYAFGPYSSKLYDDLAFLRNLRLLWDGTSENNGANDATAVELLKVAGAETSVPVRDATEFKEDVSFDFLMEGIATELPERYQTERYSLSARGTQEVEDRLRRAKDDANLPGVIDAIENIKTRFNQVPLRDLIQYVYKKYPETAERSVLKERY